MLCKFPKGLVHFVPQKLVSGIQTVLLIYVQFKKQMLNFKPHMSQAPQTKLHKTVTKIYQVLDTASYKQDNLFLVISIPLIHFLFFTLHFAFFFQLSSKSEHEKSSIDGEISAILQYSSTLLLEIFIASELSQATNTQYLSLFPPDLITHCTRMTGSFLMCLVFSIMLPDTEQASPPLFL